MENIKPGSIVPSGGKKVSVVSVSVIPTSTSPPGCTPIPPASENESQIRSGKSAVQLNDGLEKRPIGGLLRAPSRRSSREKSRSMTDAEIAADYISPFEVNQMKERLLTDDPPLSLDEARQRRASIKEERKASIEFIRKRTSSRAAQMGLPPPSVQEGVPLEIRQKERDGQ